MFNLTTAIAAPTKQYKSTSAVRRSISVAGIINFRDHKLKRNGVFILHIRAWSYIIG